MSTQNMFFLFPLNYFQLLGLFLLWPFLSNKPKKKDSYGLPQKLCLTSCFWWDPGQGINI